MNVIDYSVKFFHATGVEDMMLAFILTFLFSSRNFKIDIAIVMVNAV